MVGVAPPEVAEHDLATTDLDLGAGVGEDPIGRVDVLDDLGEVVGELGFLGGDRPLARLAGAHHERHAALVTPDRRRSEDRVAEGVVEVPVGIDDNADRGVGQLADVLLDLARLGVGRARVDDQALGPAEHESDVLVVERIATDEDASADLHPPSCGSHA